MQFHVTMSEKKKGETDTFTFIHTLLALVGPHDNFLRMKVAPTDWFLCLQSYIMLKFKAQRSFNKHHRGIQDFSISIVQCTHTVFHIM